MVNKCVADGCKKRKKKDDDNNSNELGKEKLSTFHFPDKTKFPELREKWIRFVNRVNCKEFEATDSSVLCEKHFTENLILRGKQRDKMKWELQPIPTKHTECLKRPSSCLPTPEAPPRKAQRIRGVYEDEIKDFNEKDIISNFSVLEEKHAPIGFQTKKTADSIVYYRLEFDPQTNFPKVFESIRVDTDLHVQLQYNGVKVPLPDWFVVGRDASLKPISMLHNFAPYIRSVATETSEYSSKSILDELEERKIL